MKLIYSFLIVCLIFPSDVVSISEKTIELANTTSRNDLMVFKMEMWELMIDSLDRVRNKTEAQLNDTYQLVMVLESHHSEIVEFVNMLGTELVKVKQTNGRLEKRLATLENGLRDVV